MILMAVSRRFPKDLTGVRFGRLTVMGIDHRTEKYVCYWRCMCDCGNETVVARGNLTNGKTISCGCARHKYNEETTKMRLKEGTELKDNLQSHLYHVWVRIRTHSRGVNPRYQCSPEWDRFDAFARWSMENGYRTSLGKKQHLYLVDKEKPYGPDNCQWISKEIKDAISNPSPNRPLITYRGLTMNVTAWARTLGISRPTMLYRMKRMGTDDLKKVCEAPFSITASKGHQRKVISRVKVDIDKIIEEKFELTE